MHDTEGGALVIREELDGRVAVDGDRHPLLIRHYGYLQLQARIRGDMAADMVEGFQSGMHHGMNRLFFLFDEFVLNAAGDDGLDEFPFHVSSHARHESDGHLHPWGDGIDPGFQVRFFRLTCHRGDEGCLSQPVAIYVHIPMPLSEAIIAQKHRQVQRTQMLTFQ